MPTLLRIVLWNFAFVVVLTASLATAAILRQDGIAFGLPGVCALWLLGQGARFAHRRWAMIACAGVSSLLLVLQLAVFAFLAWWQHGFGNTQSSTLWQLLLLCTAIVGTIVTIGFLRTKLPAAGNGRRVS